MFGNSLNLGEILGKGKSLVLPAAARARHVYVCGGTGVGKSKFLEHCVREDIRKWHDHHCGLILFDPHGLVCQNTMAWLARHNLKRPVVPVDLRRDDWIISYNLLRKRKETDSAVVVSNFVRALAHVWGEGGTDQTPLFARWATIVLLTLYENGYTVSDFVYLLARDDIRRAMRAKLTDRMAQQAWDFAERRPKEFEQQITSTLNRFNRLSGPKIMQATFGQPDVSLDLRSAMDDGKIILVNLSTEGGKIDKEDADTFATLLLADLWSAAQERPKQEEENIRPFYVYIDECQNFITPTIADNLDQARGFGLHLTLANQYPKRLINSGPHGQAMYDSIMANASNKIVFRLEHPEDARTMGEWLFMNTFDTDEIKLRLMSTKVMGYKEEIRESHTTGDSTTQGKSWGRGGGSFHGQSMSEGRGGMFGSDPLSDAMSSAESWNNAVADSSGESENWQEGESESQTTNKSVTRSLVSVPIMGEEVSSVQYRPIDEQIFRAMQTLFDQKDRHFAIRFHDGPKAPLFVQTPTVPPASISQKYVEEYRHRLLSDLSFALPMYEAAKRLSLREHKLLSEVVDAFDADEPVTTKRRIK